MKNKILAYSLAIISSFSLLIIILITSVDIVCYYLPNYYKNEFVKYEVDKTLKIDINNLVEVTDDMMDYLLDKRDTLADIKTTINNKDNVAFFNNKEIAHMKDVKDLFTKGRFFRVILICILIMSLILIKLLKVNIKKVLAKSFLCTSFLSFLISLILFLCISSNFSMYFVKFHEIFFTNDLWLLDPATDNLINLVPLGFFIDTSKNIAMIFILGVLVLLCSSIIVLYNDKQKQER